MYTRARMCACERVSFRVNVLQLISEDFEDAPKTAPETGASGLVFCDSHRQDLGNVFVKYITLA